MKRTAAMSASLAVSTLVVCNFLAGVGLLTKRLKKRLVLSIEMLRDLKSRGKFYKLDLADEPHISTFALQDHCSEAALKDRRARGNRQAWDEVRCYVGCHTTQRTREYFH